MKHLYFIRHGQTHANVKGVWSGTYDSPLTATGRKQVEHAAREAKKLHIDHIICSPSGRAVETAKIIAGAIGYPVEKIEINSLFVERHFGELEGTTVDLDSDLDGILDVETSDTVVERGKLAYRHLQSLSEETILVVSHGMFARALRTAINPRHPFDAGNPDTRFQNAEIVKLI